MFKLAALIKLFLVTTYLFIHSVLPFSIILVQVLCTSALWLLQEAESGGLQAFIFLNWINSQYQFSYAGAVEEQQAAPGLEIGAGKLNYSWFNQKVIAIPITRNVQLAVFLLRAVFIKLTKKSSMCCWQAIWTSSMLHIKAEHRGKRSNVLANVYWIPTYDWKIVAPV